MPDPTPPPLDVERLIRETQFVYTLPDRGETLTLRRISPQEPGFLAAKGAVDEYEDQHAFSARLLVLASVRPRLTLEAALSLGPEAVAAAVALLEFSGIVKPDEPEPS